MTKQKQNNGKKMSNYLTQPQQTINNEGQKKWKLFSKYRSTILWLSIPLSQYYNKLVKICECKSKN